MNKFKLITLLVIIGWLGSPNILFSQDEMALEILEATASKVKGMKSIKISFEYVISTAQEEGGEVYTGEFIVKGNKFRMTIDETVTYCNGKTRWVYLVESNEVNISSVLDNDEMEIEDQFMNEPLSIYTIYEKGFKYNMVGTGTFNNEAVRQIDLSPKDLNKPYFKVRYLISESNDLKAIKYFQKDGTRILLSMKSFTSNVKVKESDFVFDVSKHPDVEIIDLR